MKRVIVASAIVMALVAGPRIYQLGTQRAAGESIVEILDIADQGALYAVTAFNTANQQIGYAEVVLDPYYSYQGHYGVPYSALGISAEDAPTYSYYELMYCGVDPCS